MKMVALNNNITQLPGDNFAERAEAYYQQRPQLLSLVQDLQNAYQSLADRYSRAIALAKHHHHHHHQDHDHEQNSSVNRDEQQRADSDAESSLSYQSPSSSSSSSTGQLDGSAIVAELVMKTVDYEILLNEYSTVLEAGRWDEGWRKIELQKSLLEVLESERLILLNENGRLGYRVATLVEENRGLAAERMFMRRKAKAGELASCVLKMREDHRVCMLSRKIQDLQGQIYMLERKNKDCGRTNSTPIYHQQLIVKRGDNHQKSCSLIQVLANREEAGKAKKNTKSKKNKNGGEGVVALENCFQVDEEESALDQAVKEGGGGGGRKKVPKWWHRIKNTDLFLCGPNANFRFC